MDQLNPNTRLCGECVELEPLDSAHLEALAAIGADPTIWTYLPVRPPTENADWEKLFEDAFLARDRGEEFPFVIRHRASGRIAGMSRYLEISPKNHSLEIGWTWIGSEFQRSAVNTEAKLLLFTYAFETFGAVRVQLKTDARNLRSQRAIERIGASREGVLRQHRILHDGFIRDSVYFSVIAAEWPAVKERLQALLAEHAPSR